MNYYDLKSSSYACNKHDTVYYYLLRHVDRKVMTKKNLHGKLVSF